MPTKAAVNTAKARRQSEESGGETVLSTGIRARLTPVSAALIQDCISRVPDPPVPMWYNKEKEQDEPNYTHPEYLSAVAEAEKKRADAALDAVILFGIDLVEGVPEDDKWIRNLRFMEKRGSIDLASYDMDDELEREFVFKRYVAISADDYVLVARLSGVPAEEVARATRTFPGD